MSWDDKKKSYNLIDEWPKDIQLSLEKVDFKNKEETEEHNAWKTFEDGTFEMIPEAGMFAD